MNAASKEGKTAHTPGPWEVQGDADRVVAHDHIGAFPICDIRGWGHLTCKGALGRDPCDALDIQRANAALIAAAPDLLKALEDLSERYERFEKSNRNQQDAYYSLVKGCDEIWHNVRAAISRAKSAPEKEG